MGQARARLGKIGRGRDWENFKKWRFFILFIG
jgi:hypothetical protein